MDLVNEFNRAAVPVIVASAETGVKRALDMLSDAASGRPNMTAADNARVRAMAAAAAPTTPSAGTTTSTRRGDDEFHRGNVDGNAVLVNLRRQPAIKMVLGPSLACDNNHDFLRQVFNRTTSVSSQSGFVYTAEPGERVYNFHTYRHNIYNRPSYVTTGSTTYAGVDNYHALDVARLLTPGSELQHINGTSGGTATGPQILNPYKSVSGANEGEEHYAPWSVVDLENISYDCQQGKGFIAQVRSAANTGTTTGVAQGGFSFESTKALWPSKFFAMRSKIFQNNQLADDDSSSTVSEHLIKCKPVLKGGRVQYLFTNTGTNPACVTLVVYKVKQGWGFEDNDTQFQEGRLMTRQKNIIQTTYIDKGDKLTLKALDGRERLTTDVTTGIDHQFMPNLRAKVSSALPYIEQKRYSCVVAAGDTKEFDIKLPGRMYNPCANTTRTYYSATNAATSERYGENLLNQNAFVENMANQWSNEQYTVAVAVSGCESLARFSDPNDPTNFKTVGKTTAPARVQCRVKYTERIAAMNMQYASKAANHRDTFGTPAQVTSATFGTPKLSSCAVFPAHDAVRTVGDGVLNFETPK